MAARLAKGDHPHIIFRRNRIRPAAAAEEREGRRIPGQLAADLAAREASVVDVHVSTVGNQPHRQRRLGAAGRAPTINNECGAVNGDRVQIAGGEKAAGSLIDYEGIAVTRYSPGRAENGAGEGA